MNWKKVDVPRKKQQNKLMKLSICFFYKKNENTSLRLSISVATPLQASAILPGISRHALFNFDAIFDNDFE